MNAFLTLLWILAGCSAYSQVVINEIHYDPEPKHERVEFLELFNAGNAIADLSAWQLDRGVRYTFPEGTVIQPQGYLVLTENVDEYNRKFGSIFVGGIRSFDQWQRGTLSNQGDTVRLVDAKGTTIDVVDYRVGFPWPVAPNDETGLSMELIHPSLDNDLGSSWRPASEKPTPGKANSVLSERTPPNIRQVSHSPKAPGVGEVVTISAKVTDPDGVARVELLYQSVTPGNYLSVEDETYEALWESVAMTAQVNNTVYLAEIPASVQQHRHLIRYRIEIEDALGNAVRAPFADDPTPNFAYFCYGDLPVWTGAAIPGETEAVTYGPDVLKSLPIYHLISHESDVLASQYNTSNNNKNYRFLGTLVVDGVVYDHMRYRIRGHGSTYNTGKNKWKWRFNRGNLFQGCDDFGRKYKEPVRTLNISALASPWNPANRGMAGLDEALAFRMWQMAGVPAVNTNYLQLRIIDDAMESNPNDQYEGDLWGLYLAIEQFDGRALRARDLPDGNVYNMHFANSNYLNEGRGQVTDRSDLNAFISRLGYNRTPTQPVEWWRENVNLDWYYSYRAIWEVINHSDQRDQENSHYYHNPETNQWSIHPWDVDLLYEEFDRWGPDAVQTKVPFEQFRKCLEHPELQLEFQNRARELQDLFLNDDQLWHLIDEFAVMVGSRASDEPALQITEVSRKTSRVTVATAEPHGFEVGSTVYVTGVMPQTFSGAKEILEVPEPNQFVHAASLFAPAVEPISDRSRVSAAPSGSGWWAIDQARWDRHPRSRAVEGPSTRTGSFYVNPFKYTRFSGKVRTLLSPDFPGMVQWVKHFTVPPGFGGQQLRELINDNSTVPRTPVITYVGQEGHPIEDLHFASSEFRAAGQLFKPIEFAAMQWRAAEVYNPSITGYTTGEPRIYEIDSVWESDLITEFSPGITLPNHALRLGRTYRVRVRHSAKSGVWSHWSDPIEFQPTANLSEFAALELSEIMYHPSKPSAAELAAGFEESDFEFVEILNNGSDDMDLSSFRFTKGINMSLTGIIVPAGERILLARNADAFALRHGADLMVAATWGNDRLSNTGERLKLTLGAGVGVIDLRYEDDHADGTGESLHWIDGQWLAEAPTPGRQAEHNTLLELIAHDLDLNTGALTLTWRSEKDASYQLERTATLNLWDSHGDAVNADSEETTLHVEAARDDLQTRYFRIRQLP